MKAKSIWLSLLALGVIAALIAWRFHAPSANGFVLTQREAYRFEPQPHVIATAARRPVVTTTVAGDVYILTAEDQRPGESELFLRASHDAGDTWMAPLRLSAPGASVSTSAETAPQLAAHGMYVYALWQERTDHAGAQLRLARSSEMGQPPTIAAVTDKMPQDESYSGFSTLGVAPNGDVYAVWLDGRDTTSASAGTFDVYLARSTDKGISFHKNVRVATSACPCCRPSIAFGAHGEVYVAYRHVYAGNQRDIALGVSRDGGEHFDRPVRVAADRWKLLGCPESGPVLAVQHENENKNQNGNRKEKLFVAWYTAAGERPGVRLAESLDSGRSFLPEAAISGEILSANHPSIAASEDGTIALAFSGRISGVDGAWSALYPYVVRIAPEGRVSAPQRLPVRGEGGRYPTIALAEDGGAFVAWSGSQSNGATAFLERASPLHHD